MKGEVLLLRTAAKAPKETTGTQKVHQQALESVRVKARAPPDPAASSRPCPLGTSCICSLCGCAGRCLPLRTPCMCSLSERAGRCSTLRTPCTRSFSERAGRCSTLRTPCIGLFSERAGRCSTLRTSCIGLFSERAGKCSPLRTRGFPIGPMAAPPEHIAASSKPARVNASHAPSRRARPWHRCRTVAIDATPPMTKTRMRMEAQLNLSNPTSPVVMEVI